MQNVIEAIEEIQSMLERQVEWPLTDKIGKEDINIELKSINSSLEQLKMIASEL